VIISSLAVITPVITRVITRVITPSLAPLEEVMTPCNHLSLRCECVRGVVLVRIVRGSEDIPRVREVLVGA